MVDEIESALGDDAADALNEGTALEYTDAVEFALDSIAQAT